MAPGRPFPAAPGRRDERARRPAPGLRARPADAALRELVPLRPQGPVELVDRATHLFRARFVDLLTITLAFTVPVWLVLAIVLRDGWAQGLFDNVLVFWSGFVPGPFLLQLLADTADQGGVAGVLLGRGLPSLSLAAIGFACGHLVSSWANEVPTSGSDAVRATLRRGHHVFALWALVHVVELATCVGTLLGPLFFGIAAPLLAIEGGGPWRTFRRSWRLSTRQFWRIVALVPVATFVAVLVGGLLGGVPLAFLSAFTGGWIDLGGAASVTLAGVLPHLALDPLLGLSMALLALDLQVRVDGADLEAELARLRRA